MARILIVDDEKSIRTTLRAFLQGDGHEVEVAGDADVAVELLEKGDFDVVVTDIVLPRVSGVELLEAIRKASPHVPVVMMTGEPTVETATRALRVGAFEYLVKPVTKEAILRVAANASRVKALDDERRALEKENRQYQDRLEQMVEERTQALCESEERYRQLVEHSPDGIAVHLDGKVAFLNRAMAEMVGGSPADVVGKPIEDFVRPDFREMVRQRVQQVLQERKPVPRMQEIFLRLDGTHVNVDVASLPFVHQGRPAVQIVVRDITQQKRLEEQIRHAQKMEAIGQLAGGVAHDFNNILQAIMGYAKLAAEGLSPGESRYDDLEEIRTAAERAAALTRQLLIFGRRGILQPRDLDLNEVVANLIKMLRRVIGENVELDVIPGHDLGTVNADPGQMEQVLMNLCVNARDAMPEGGRITIETENILINSPYCQTHPWARQGRYVLLTVSDTGAGMSPEVQKRIFEPFFTTKGEGKGTGLGLATVYGIVKEHEGYVYVYSEVDKGTTFKVYLPVVNRRAASVGRKIEGPVPGGRERILLAEDDPKIRNMAVRILEGAGYAVLTASDGLEAARVFESEKDRVDLVLLDAVMPKMSGREVYARIKAVKPEVGVLFSSGYATESISPDFFRTEGVNLLQKPYSPDDLLRKVREALDRDSERVRRRDAGI